MADESPRIHAWQSRASLLCARARPCSLNTHMELAAMRDAAYFIAAGLRSLKVAKSCLMTRAFLMLARAIASRTEIGNFPTAAESAHYDK